MEKNVHVLKRNIPSYLSRNSLFLYFLSFLMGRAVILDGLIPFGLALFAILLIDNRKNWVYGIGISIGILSVGGQIRSLITLVLVYIVINYVNKVNLNTFRLGLITSLINLVFGAIYLYLTDFYLYDLFMVTFESIAIFVFIYILSYALPLISTKSNRRIISNEELICTSIVISVAILGIYDAEILGYSLKNALGILLTLIFAYNGGPAIGATVGITIGVVTSMSQIGTPTIIGIYAFSGLLAGIFKDMGKIPSGLGMILGNSILTFYINGSTEVIIEFEEVFAACLIFLFLPKRFNDYITNFINSKISTLNIDKAYSERIKKLTLRQLREYSRALSELAATYSNIADKEKVVEEKDITTIINNIANSICIRCSMRRSCWESFFYSTYNAMIDSITILESNGELNGDNLPSYLKKRCLKTEELVKEIIGKFDIYKVNYKWNKRLIEMRQLASEQFQNIAEVIEDFSRAIEANIEFNKDVEDAIYVAFDKENIFVDNVTVLEREKDAFEIEIERKNCYNRSICEEVIVPLVSRVVGRELVQKNKGCNLKEDDKKCVIRLTEAQRYRVTTGVARIPKGNICGDCYSFLELKDNKYMIALSDGMGVGEVAAKESTATITLLEQLMESGFRKDIAIKTINSVLMSKSLDEAFSTIDMAILDLYTGKIEFVKIGAVATFIKKSDGEVIIIESSSLPAGIVSEINFHSELLKLEDGDIIVHVTDGILDADKNLIDRNMWFVNILKDIDNRNPQAFADAVLDRVLERSNNKVEDDMTVLVTKVWKRH